MEHFITSIHINEVRHLKNIEIKLNPEKRQHLILTGKNGSGKTSVLKAVRNHLQMINDGMWKVVKWEYPEAIRLYRQNYNNAKTDREKIKAQESIEKISQMAEQHMSGCNLLFSDENALESLYAQGNFITAYFAADRTSKIQRVHGAEDVKLETEYPIDSEPSKILLKYMVHLKTQQAYARNEDDLGTEAKIASWFLRFRDALRVLLDDESIELRYDYKNYNFLIEQKGRNPYGLDQLSDGYSAIIGIVADLILRMDRNWLLKGELSQYDAEGVVLIDELETHLHVELQRKILPFLTEFFPRIQFIITTHSAYILNSISNACIYDLEKQKQYSDFSNYSADDIAEGYFDADNYSEQMQNKINRYRELVAQKDPSEDERAERARLRMELKNSNRVLEREITEEFAEIEEERRSSNGQI